MTERNDYIDAMRYAYGIDTDNISESKRLAKTFGIADMYPFKAARGNCKSFYSSRLWTESLRLKIEKVIFNEPATIVLWSDGTKTVVKCDESEEFDHEKGLAMAIAKRFLRTNTTGSNYYDEFKKWLPKKETEPVTVDFTLYAEGVPIITEALDGLTNSITYMLRKIPEEKMDSIKGKHFKDN